MVIDARRAAQGLQRMIRKKEKKSVKINSVAGNPLLIKEAGGE